LNLLQQVNHRLVVDCLYLLLILPQHLLLVRIYLTLLVVKPALPFQVPFLVSKLTKESRARVCFLLLLLHPLAQVCQHPNLIQVGARSRRQKSELKALALLAVQKAEFQGVRNMKALLLVVVKH